MDFHKKEWEEKPVVMDKPRRGREMVTTDVPKDLLDTMRMMTAKQQLKGGQDVKTALEAEREGNVELYHEGWMDGKKYLVPDSNLEIMKDLVNLRVRRKGDSVFVKGKDYKASKLDTDHKFQRRLRALSGKINELEAANMLKKKSMYKESEVRSAIESTGSSVERKKPFEIVPMSEESTNFLISGHIRKNANPVFIIQKYKGKSPFNRKRSDFSQVKSARNVDILISGNFFRKSVLEEGIHSIDGIRLKWNQLIPVDERSKLYERRFSEHFKVKGVDILFEGDFIKENGLFNYTPILTFLVPRSHSSRRPESRKNDQSMRRNMYRSISDVFSRKNVTTYNVQFENKSNMKSITEFTSRENNSIESNIDTEGLDEEVLTDQDEDRDYVTDVESVNDNESCKIHVVVVASKNGKRSVAGGSSSINILGGRLNNTFLVEECQNMIGKEWDNHDIEDKEHLVIYAPKSELWSPFCSVEPHLRSHRSHSNCDESICDEKISDQGDAGCARCTLTIENKSKESLPRNKSRRILQVISGLKQKNLHTSKDKLVQRTFVTNESISKGSVIDYKIPEYKCQVRPSKNTSKRNCILRNMSKLFSK